MTLLANHPRREDWIENRADEIYAKWVEAYPILRKNEDALSDIAMSEAAAEYEAEMEMRSIERAEAEEDRRERRAA